MAVLRSGSNHARHFEFEEALDEYLTLATGDDCSSSDLRLTALRTAAQLHDDLRQYDESAKLYEEIARQAKPPSEKAEAMFSRAEVLAKTGDVDKTIAAFEDFLEDHGGQPTQAVLEVEAHLRLGLLFRELGRHEDAKRELSLTLEGFNRELQPGTPEAALPAEAQFMLAEYALEDLMRIPLVSTSSKQRRRESERLADAMIEVAGEYDEVFGYRSLDWTIAAIYRRGHVFEMVVNRVVDAPVPSTLDEVTYQNTITESMKPLIQKAIEFYEECVKRGKEYGVSDAWTARALERLNVHKPDEYPTLRDAALVFVLEDRR